MTKTVRIDGGRKRRSLNKKMRVLDKKTKVARRNGSRRRIKMIMGGGGKNILLVIDPQRDFCDIEETSSKQKGELPFGQTSDSAGLPVPGASKDLDRLCEFLKTNPTAFKEIHISLDSHTKTHIGHIGFWTPTGYTPEEVHPLPIPLETFYIDSTKQSPNFDIFIGDFLGNPKTPPQKAYTYKKELQKVAYAYVYLMQEKRKKDSTIPIPCLWAEHCIIGSNGWNLYEPLKTTLEELKVKDIKINYHEKGTNDLVEMYSLFSAEVTFKDLFSINNPINFKFFPKLSLTDLPEEYQLNYTSPSVPEPNVNANTPNQKRNYATLFNRTMFYNLMGFNGENKVFVCGEAKSHCVKTSLQDMIKNCGGKLKTQSIHLISDMTSGIPGFEEQTAKAYDIMAKKGMQIIDSSNILDKLLK